MNYVQAKFERLTPSQRVNVFRRLAVHRARIPRPVWLFALSTTIDLELSGAPMPDPCPGSCGAPDPRSQDLRIESIAAVCMLQGLPPKPW
jgi:hypothetical protein